MAEWFVVVNPEAGQGKTKRLWPEIQTALHAENILFDSVSTTAAGQVSELIHQAICQGFRSFISIGGDGTINELINGLYRQNRCKQSDCIIGHIPAGTANDWGKSAGIPSDYHLIIPMIKSLQVIEHDVGCVRYTRQMDGLHTDYFINVAGTGFDAFVAQKTNKLKAKFHIGKLSYLVQLFLCLVAYRTTHMRIEIGSQVIDERIFSLSVGIGKYNGSGMKQLPDARIDDGLLDITLIKNMPKWQVVTNIPKVYDGSFVTNPHVVQYRCAEIKIASDPPAYLEIDGNTGGLTPCVLSILPEKIRIIGGCY
jgi:diacylglycerol kinase (ATP)